MYKDRKAIILLLVEQKKKLNILLRGVRQWRIHDFPQVAVANLLFGKSFAEHCMKMKNWTWRGGGRRWGWG